MTAQVRKCREADAAAWRRMRAALYEGSEEEQREEVKAYFRGEARHIDQVLVAESAGGELVGFVELRIRNYAEGSEKTAVPYLEGWFVEEAQRKNGVGGLLVKGAEQWAREQGHDELASDALIDNLVSIAAHKALGFEEVERSVCFIKRL